MPRRAFSPKRSARSQSADQLDFYPPLNSAGVFVKDQAAQVQSKPKDKESPGSLSRRNSAPLLRSESKKGNKPKRIDTSSYLRPGITPTHGKMSPARQMSTFGPVYIPPWETSRPSTAPLANDSILSGDEADELLGGVHYSTYGARDDDTLMSYDGPFSDASVPVPEELFTQAELNEIARAEQEAAKLKHKRSRSGSGLLRMVVGDDDKDTQPRSRKGTLTSIVLPQSLTSSSSSRPNPSSQSYVTIGTGTEQSHGTTSQEDTTLISMSKFPMPPAESVPPTPATVQPGTPGTPVFGARPTTPGFTGARPTTPGSMTTIQQGRTTPGPMTPAVPDFLINSRADADSEPEPEPRRLRTKSSLLALAKSFTGADSGSSTPKSDPRGATTPLTEHGSSTPGSSTPQPRPIASRTDSSNPRRRSMLERLAARLGGASAQDETWVDESFTSDLESDNERALRDQLVSPVLDFDLPEEPLIDLEQFGMIIGSSSPVRAQASATFPPMQGPPAFFPTEPPEPRNRTLSKLSTTGRKVLNKVDGGRRRTVSVFSAGSRKSRKHTRGMSRESANQRRMSRESAIQRRASADMLSAEGSIEGTVMYGVGEEMLRLMFGGALEEQPERERTRSLPRRVSGPKRSASSPKALGSPKRATMTRKQSKNQRATHEAEGENHHAGDAGSLDLKFSPPNPMVIPAIPRRKGHRRTGSNSASKENVSVRPLSVRAKSPVERVKSPVERAKSPVERAGRAKSPVERAKSPVSVRAKSPVEIRPALKSRSRSKSAPLGFVEFDPKPAGILTNGRSTPNSARVVIVNSATTPNLPPTTPRRQVTRSTPLTPPTPEDNTLTQPGVIVTAPTPPAPRRASSMPLDGLSGSGDSPRDSVEPQRATMSRGTSVQFVPESYENPRRSGRSRREAPSNASSSGPPVLELSGTVSGNGKGKRKVDREVSDAPDASMSNPSKKPKLSEEEIDITFMGEPLFGGHPQRRGGLGSIDRASSHHSSYSRHSQSYSRHSQSYSRHSQSFHRPAPNPYPSPTSSPEPERGTIPIHAILTPRVQSLYGTGSIYDSRRQSISSIPRPKSRASARSNATGRRSNMTGARSARSNRTGVSGKSGPRPLKDRLPMQGWCFLIGFFFPFAWWYAAFARAERGYYGGGVWSSEVESQWEGVRTDVHRDDGRIVTKESSLVARPRGSATDSTSNTRSYSPLAVPELADESLTLCRPLMFMSIPGSYQHNRPGDLEKLPQELVVRVLEHCGFRTILCFSETCRAYHALVTNSSRLQLKIELGANGLQIPRRYLTDDGLRSRELLKQIVRRRDSWLDLRLNPGHSLPRTTSGQRFTLWELRDGIFASAFFTGEFRPLEANAIKMIVLDPPILDWTLSFDFTFHELTIDPVQDLLVLAAADDANSHSLTLRFRSLKTGVAHPSAKQGIIPIPLDYSVHPHPIYSTVSLVVTDEMLLVSLIAHDAKLPYDILVWDWHAGVLLTRTDRRMGLCGATFLDHTRFIVYEGLFSSPGEPDTPISDSLNLLIYDIPPARPSTNSAHATSETPPSEPILQFEFPQFGHSTWILNADFLLRTAPIPSSTPCTPELLFDPSCRILSLSMRLSMNDASVSFLVFVDSSQIFTHLARAQLEGRTYIPWKEWGEHSTRWIRYNSDPNPWINWLHGTKYVLGRQVIDEQPEIQDNPYLAVADFHSLTIKRSESRQLGNYVSSHEQDGVAASRLEAIRDGKWAFLDCYHEGAKLVEGQLAVDIVDSDTPTVITDFGPIPIVSRLPYRLAVSRPSQSVKGCSDWMIDNNRIIGIGSPLPSLRISKRQYWLNNSLTGEKPSLEARVGSRVPTSLHRMSFEKLSGWGPGIRKYSATFEKRISASFDRYATNKESTVEVSSNLIPISLLETTLAAGENMHKAGFQSGSQVFPVLMSTLRTYMEQQTETLFDRYYGFLCIRHLTRMICIGTLTEAGCFDDFMDDLEPDMTSEEVMELLVEDALDAMSDTLSLGSQLDIAELFGYLESGEKAFVIDGGLTADDVDFLVNALWEGRRWVVELTSEALLPGFPALLFVLCQMTALMKCPPSEKQWPLIQDLLLRCYLGQMADAERILIRQLGAFIDTQIRRHEIPNKYFPVDRDDALDVAYAYMDLLAPPLDLDSAPVMRLDISLILFLYTYKLTTGNGKGIVSEEIVPGIVRAGLARLQLELDVDGQAEAQEAGRGAIREYASYVFRFMGLYHERLVSRRARFAFAQVLFDEDIYGLAGRVLMLVTKETSDQPAKWDTLILNFSNLERLVGAFSSLTGPQLNLAALEWRKIVVHLLYLSTLKQSYGKYLGASFDAWSSLNPPTVEHAIDKFRCDNPRCPIQNPHMRVPESKITCAKCTSVVYCSQMCQQT